jgi:hypothetical protein
MERILHANRILYVLQNNLIEAAIAINGFKRAGWVVGLLLGDVWGILSPHQTWGLSADGSRSVVYVRRGGGPLNSKDLNAAIQEFKPALVVPDYMYAFSLMTMTANDSSSDASTRRLLRCSLSSPQFWPALQSKAAMVELARRSGLRVPSSWALFPWAPPAGQVHALLHSSTVQLPLVLKSDIDGNGQGVTICKTAACVDQLPQGIVSAQVSGDSK